MNGQWYTKRWLAVSLHVLFWALIFSFPFLLRQAFDQNPTHRPRVDFTGFYLLSFTDNLVYMLLFYGNAHLFIPRLIYKRKYGEYLLVLIIALGILFLVNRFFFNLFIPGAYYKVLGFFIFHLPFFFFIIIASTALRMIRDRMEESRRAKEKETENLKTELSLLRSQVSPHFMFNIMNNMVALARKKSDLLEPSLIKLSSLLRYMLYETEEKVSLQKEVEYLQSYIDLQQQRFGNNVAVKSCMQKIDRNYEIEPMLLIPFVENAFKHGTSVVTKVPGSDLVVYNISEIDIDLVAENHKLEFSVRNRYNENSNEVKDKTSGIGLNNVKRRLNLLYGSHHSLQIEKKDGWFITSLQIILD